MIKYESDPKKIRIKSLQLLRDQASLGHLNEDQQQIALFIMEACGDLSITQDFRISENAIERTFETLEEDYELLCDTEVVQAALNEKHLEHEPVCLINKASVISQAKAHKTTRSMMSVDQWKNYMPGSIVLIGNEPTALLRLLEILEEEDDQEKKPALIIATPVGFCGAEASKKYLWDHREKLGIPCITLLGTRGGGMMAATILNTLIKMKQNIYF